jgi:hypothetical protein
MLGDPPFCAPTCCCFFFCGGAAGEGGADPKLHESEKLSWEESGGDASSSGTGTGARATAGALAREDWASCLALTKVGLRIARDGARALMGGCSVEKSGTPRSP